MLAGTILNAVAIMANGGKIRCRRPRQPQQTSTRESSNVSVDTYLRFLGSVFALPEQLRSPTFSVGDVVASGWRLHRRGLARGRADWLDPADASRSGHVRTGCSRADGSSRISATGWPGGLIGWIYGETKWWERRPADVPSRAASWAERRRRGRRPAASASLVWIEVARGRSPGRSPASSGERAAVLAAWRCRARWPYVERRQPAFLRPAAGGQLASANAGIGMAGRSDGLGGRCRRHALVVGVTWALVADLRTFAMVASGGRGGAERPCVTLRGRGRYSCSCSRSPPPRSRPG
jgi:hypothetical protein